MSEREIISGKVQPLEGAPPGAGLLDLEAPARSRSPNSRASSRASGSRSRSSSPAGSRARSGSRSGESSRSEDEQPTERKDIEDSGSEQEEGALEVDEDRGSPRNMSVDSGNSDVEKSKERHASGGSDQAEENRGGWSGCRRHFWRQPLHQLRRRRRGLRGKAKARPKRSPRPWESDEDSDREVQRYDDDQEMDIRRGWWTVPSRPSLKSVRRRLNKKKCKFQETRIDVEVPKITTDLGKDLYFVKLPNFLSVECRPFDAENYEDEIEDEGDMDEEGRQRLKLKVENTIRWRQAFTDEGKAFKRIQCQDGQVVGWLDQFVFGERGVRCPQAVAPRRFQSHVHPSGNWSSGPSHLQDQTVPSRPHSTESKTHQKMTRQMADRSHKNTGIKVISQVITNFQFIKKNRA